MSNVTKTLTVRYKQEGGAELERIAKQITRAQQTVAEASAGAYKVVGGGAIQLGGAERGYRALQSRLEGMTKASRQFHADIKALDSAMKAGVIQGAEYARQLDRIKSNLADAGAPMGRDTGAALAISRRFQIGAEPANPARASASAFEDAYREQERAAAALRAQLDPLGTAQAEFNAQLTTYRGLASAGVISTNELAQAEALVGTRMAMAEKHIAATGAATKLTGYQMTGLGYQINDIGTMLAMGASPFMILSSQAGQVIQVLGDGPGGVTGSLGAIGAGLASLITPTTAIAAGLLAAGAAALYFTSNSYRGIKPLTDAMADHRTVITGIASQYGIVLKASEKYATSAERAFAIRRSAAELSLSARSELQTNFSDGGIFGNPVFTPKGGYGGSGQVDEYGRTMFGVASQFQAFEEPLMKFREGLQAGKGDAIALVEAIAKIAEDNAADVALNKSASVLTGYAAGAAEAQRQVKALTESIEDAKRAKLEDAFAAASGRLREMVPDFTTDAERARRAYEDTIGSINRLPGSDKQLDREGLRAGAARDYALVLSEIERQESQRRTGYELDLRSIGARTAAERALIAAEQERLALSGEVMDSATRARRIEEARALSLAQSSFAERESLRKRIKTEQDAVASMMNQLGVMGRTAGETARLTTEFEALADAKRAAFDEGRTLGEEEINRITRHAAEVGRLTEALAGQKLAQDATFERSQLFRSEEDQQIAAPLRSCGIDTGKGSYL